MVLILFTLCYLALAACNAAVEARTVLALPMFGGNSPSMDVMSVAGELQQRGYNLLIPTADIDVPFMHKALARHRHQRPPAGTSSLPPATPGTLQYITFQSPKGSFQQVISKELMGSGNTGLSMRRIAPVLLKLMSEPCQWLLTNTSAMQAIREAAPDVILTFGVPFGGDSCGCVVSHALGVPYVVVDGNPLVRTPLKYPQFPSDLTQSDLRTPLGWIKNTAIFVFTRTLFTVLPLMLPHWRTTRAAAGLQSSGSYGGCHPPLRLHMKTFDLEYPRPLPPNDVMLGPCTPRLPNPPQQQQADHPATWAFLEGADPAAGVVLVGFGSSGIYGLSMTKEDFVNLAQAFTDLAPTRVLWALLPSNLPQGLTLDDLPLGPNVLVVPWVDYNDVLGHPATRLFISHCGIHSIWEAAFHGVPVIGVPFQQEQAANAAKLASRGMGEVHKEAVAFRSAGHSLLYQRATMRELALKVLNNGSYHEAAAAISARLQAHASFRTPIQRAADQVEVLLAGSRQRPHPSSIDTQ